MFYTNFNSFKMQEIKINKIIKLQLKHPMMAKGNVEVWLGDLLKLQQSSLQAVISEAYSQMTEENFDIHQYIETAPAQVCEIINAMRFKRELCLT